MGTVSLVDGPLEGYIVGWGNGETLNLHVSEDDPISYAFGDLVIPAMVTYRLGDDGYGYYVKPERKYQLLHCPFCGSPAKWLDMGDERLSIRCTECPARFGDPWGKDRKVDLARGWNRCANYGLLISRRYVTRQRSPDPER